MKPKLFLHLEGAAVLTAAGILYGRCHGGWPLFALLFFTPDFSMLGYVGGKKIGALAYNLAHTYTAPLLLWLILLAADPREAQLSLIWLAHIGFDRTLGYGLKYETSFKDTHLQRV